MIRATGRRPRLVSGPPVPGRGEVRRFGAGERSQAIAWALAGGVAIHGDFDRLDSDGITLQVLGQLTVLLEWGSRHGLSGQYVRRQDRRLPMRFEVTGGLARELAREVPER